jgi:N-acetylneuraminic acid mutarotase
MLTRALAWFIGGSVVALGAPQLEWRRLPDLPDPVGRKGMYGGVSEGHVVLAGGSNFPVAQASGGAKQFHREIFVWEIGAASGEPWRKAASELPETLGEGATVSTPRGVVCVGGNNGTTEVASVFLLRYNRQTRDVERTTLPELPAKTALAGADEFDGWVYVAGGLGAGGSLRTFWRLNIARALAAPATAAWETLPPLRVAARYGCFLTAVTTAEGPRFIFGGGIAGPARSQLDYLRDVAWYDPAAGRWRRGAGMPRGAVAGATLALDGGRMLLLGGSDGHDFERMRQLGERYRLPNDVLLYEAETDRWTTVGTMPVGVTSATVVKVPDGWIVAGGEHSPGLRTAQVHELRVRER